jgi:hypothetical protein
MIEGALDRLGAIGLWRTALAIAILQFAVVVTVAGYAADVGPREPYAGSWEELAAGDDDLLSGVIAPLQRWDALWYQHIASDGYGSNDGTTAFLPLFPALGSLLSLPLFGNAALALVIVAFLSYVVALWLLAKLAIREATDRPPTSNHLDYQRPLRSGVVTMLVLATFPTAFFFVAPYTESLFLALAVATILLARSGRPGLAALTAALASFVRFQGLFLALPIAWEAMRSAGLFREWGEQAWDLRWRAIAKAAATGSSPVIAIIAWYAAISLLFDGSPVGMAAQAPWGYQLAAPWDAVIDSVRYVAARFPRPPGWIEGLNLVCLLGFAALTISTTRLPISHTLYAVPSLALIGTRTMFLLPLMSVSRYVLVLFPGFLVLGSVLQGHPRVLVAWLTISTLGQLALVQYFARWGFVA